mgnify:CR=1 FL=1
MGPHHTVFQQWPELLHHCPHRALNRQALNLDQYKKHEVGAVSFDTETGVGSFEFEPRFIETGIELSPIKMPLSRKIYSFPESDRAAFHGLPGMIADSLPDDFGNAVLNANR